MQVACSSQSYDDVLREGRWTLVDWLRFAAEDESWISVEYEGAEPSQTAVPCALAYLRRAMPA